ncbi:hypothetical protein SAMN06265380_11219 [Ruegeria faecimaris]|uniref:YmgD protein n=2 Tax=Ruegeria faecimaris TaxID=686389 RepID=A0A521EP60_9RHOB|nr:hypothetical protein SAMN06265380_11219 [Ruegeria faecimaris]
MTALRLTQMKTALASLCMIVPGMAIADEAAEQMVQDALPVMYHTCATVVEESDGDEAYIFAVVEKMTALSIYNRQIDINDHASTDEDKAKLRETFIAALREGCAEDQHALLGGVIDNAVKTTLGL